VDARQTTLAAHADERTRCASSSTTLLSPSTGSSPARTAATPPARAISRCTTYEIGLAAGVTNAYPHLRHLVFSTTMGQSPDPTVELVAADPAQTVRRLKAEEGLDIQPHLFRPTDLRQLDSGIRILTFDRR
jgi:hypothetical protein